MLTLALELKTISVAPKIIDTLVPLVPLTIQKVLAARFYKDLSKYPMDGEDKFIDVTACLSLLYLTALGCMSEVEHITRFWRLIPNGIILGCLSKNQPIQDFELMLKLLSTSVLRDSFSTVMPNNSQQQIRSVDVIIDRLGFLLAETPHSPGEDAKTAGKVMLRMRLAMLPLLISMTRSPFASAALARHRVFLARLVWLMSDELDNLYDWAANHELRFVLFTFFPYFTRVSTLTSKKVHV